MATISDKTEVKSQARPITGTAAKVEEYKQRLELLYDVAQQASSPSDVSMLLEHILHVTQQLIQAEAASLLLVDRDKKELCFQAVEGKVVDPLRNMKLDLDSGIAGWVVHHGTPLVCNDVAADERFNNKIDKVTGFVTRSIIAVPVSRGQNVIGVIELLNKAEGGDFTEKDLAILTGFAATEALVLLLSMAATAIYNIKLHQAVRDGLKSTVETLVAASDAKDPYAYGHSRRVKDYALLAAISLSFSPEQLQIIEFGALLHDMGKIGIYDNILRKSGSLTEEEWYIMRKHPLRGANIVGEIPFLEKARDIVLYHHERYDGTGYPKGLKGEKIPIGARLVAVADAFDTMTTELSYRPKLSIEDALKELKKNAGTQFCPVAVEALISGLRKSGKLLEPENEPAAAKIAEDEVEEVGNADEADEILNREAEEEATPEAEEEAAVEVEEEAAQETEEAEETTNARDMMIYEGKVKLLIPALYNFYKVTQFTKHLNKNKKIVVESSGWSADKGYNIIISVKKPLNLIGALNNMPIVEEAEEKDGNITITLKTSARTHLSSQERFL